MTDEVKVDGILGHEDEMAEGDFIFSFFVVADDGGQEEIEDPKAENEGHESKKKVGEEHSDGSFFRCVLEIPFKVKLGHSEAHHEDHDSTLPKVGEGAVLPLFKIALQNPEAKRKPVKKNDECKEVEGGLAKNDVEHGCKVPESCESRLSDFDHKNGCAGGRGESNQSACDSRNERWFCQSVDEEGRRNCDQKSEQLHVFLWLSVIGNEDLLLDHIEAEHLEDKMDHKESAGDKDEELEIISCSRFHES